MDLERPLVALTSGAAEYHAAAILTSVSALAGLFLWEHIWCKQVKRPVDLEERLEPSLAKWLAI